MYSLCHGHRHVPLTGTLFLTLVISTGYVEWPWEWESPAATNLSSQAQVCSQAPSRARSGGEMFLHKEGRLGASFRVVSARCHGCSSSSAGAPLSPVGFALSDRDSLPGGLDGLTELSTNTKTLLLTSMRERLPLPV